MIRPPKNFKIIVSSFIVILIFTAFSAISLIKKQKGKEELIGFKNPTIVGNSNKTSLCLSPEYMLNAWYNKERLDSITDTLDLSTDGKTTENLWYDFMFPKKERQKKSNSGLRVIVDTINELTMKKKPIWARYLFNNRFTWQDSTEILQDDTLIQNVKSFPIYIANLSNIDTALIQVQDGSFMMTVEAIDPNGKWKPIECWSNSWCGNSYFTLLVPPKHMYMTRGIKCSGSFSSTCRMKVYNGKDSIYSNEFRMTINETQFINPIQKDNGR